MGKLKDKLDITGFTIDSIDISEIEDLVNWLPKNGALDLNIAEDALIKTLHAQDICQEIIIKIDRHISIKDGEKSKAFARAALDRAVLKGFKTAKDKECFALADDEYIDTCNELAIAKAAKKWFENKASHFSNWYFCLMAFLKRDYNLEKLGNYQGVSKSVVVANPEKDEDNIGEVSW